MLNDEEVNLNSKKVNTNDDECELSGTSLTTTLYKQVTRFRESSPRWFNNNPACAHRLLNFLVREVKALYSLAKNSQFSIDRYEFCIQNCIQE